MRLWTMAKASATPTLQQYTNTNNTYHLILFASCVIRTCLSYINTLIALVKYGSRTRCWHRYCCSTIFSLLHMFNVCFEADSFFSTFCCSFLSSIQSRRYGDVLNKLAIVCFTTFFAIVTYCNWHSHSDISSFISNMSTYRNDTPTLYFKI